MSNRKAIQYTFRLAWIALLLAGCGKIAASDFAVCDAYQQLVDVWPSNSDEVKAANSLEEIWGSITDAGEVLITASKAADTPDLGKVGQSVGEAAVSFPENNAKLINQGFVPFFDESLIGGSDLSRLCEEIGKPVTLP